MIDKGTVFNVYNEYDGDIYGISSFNDFGYKFERANELGEPSITPVPFADIQLMNNKSSVFRDATLRFEPELEDEIYKELRITPNNNYLTKDEITDIILNTDTDKLDKLIKITSSNTMEKVRSVLVQLDNTNQYDIPKRVFDVVNARMYELAKGRVRSEIKLVTKKNTKVIKEEVVEMQESTPEPKVNKEIKENTSTKKQSNSKKNE